MTDQTQNEKYMQLALDLAKKGLGLVEPNPAVGCVIVKDQKVIGTGYHEKFGTPHAEINALNDCRTNGHDPQNATVFVTLEPCCHHGKTPPCTDALINAKITKLFAPTSDPSPHVAGKGFQQLRNAGIEVNIGLAAEKAQLLKPWFFKFAKTKKPWVIVKWAQTKDGFLSARDTSGITWISNEKSRQHLHATRRSVQAILVGINTVILDNPLLTPRPHEGKHPLRIVLDSHLCISLDCNLLTNHESPTMIATTEYACRMHPQKVLDLKKTKAEILPLGQIYERCDLSQLLTHLGLQNVQRLLVEGGPTVIDAFLKTELADEVQIYLAPGDLKENGTAPVTEEMQLLTNPDYLHYPTVTDIDGDTYINGLLKPIGNAR